MNYQRMKFAEELKLVYVGDGRIIDLKKLI
jgi:hypothetical protein